jgi:hypothetical protein
VSQCVSVAAREPVFTAFVERSDVNVNSSNVGVGSIE